MTERGELVEHRILYIERFHRKLLDEHLHMMGRTKWYESLEEMQQDLPRRATPEAALAIVVAERARIEKLSRLLDRVETLARAERKEG